MRSRGAAVSSAGAGALLITVPSGLRLKIGTADPSRARRASKRLIASACPMTSLDVARHAITANRPTPATPQTSRTTPTRDQRTAMFSQPRGCPVSRNPIRRQRIVCTCRGAARPVSEVEMSRRPSSGMERTDGVESSHDSRSAAGSGPGADGRCRGSAGCAGSADRASDGGRRRTGRHHPPHRRRVPHRRDPRASTGRRTASGAGGQAKCGVRRSWAIQRRRSFP